MYAGDVAVKERQVSMTETVEEFMDDIVSKPATVSTSANLKDALDAILASGITRKAYVLDDDGRLQGMISIETLMRHFAERIGARPPGVISWLKFLKDMESDKVVDFMAKAIPVTRKTPVIEIVKNVVSQHLNDFPVVEADGKLIGEVNTNGLLKIARSVFPR
jgi:CBS-domain-containing membrane protein